MSRTIGARTTPKRTLPKVFTIRPFYFGHSRFWPKPIPLSINIKCPPSLGSVTEGSLVDDAKRLIESLLAGRV
jgi:hypothetical protein